MIVLFRLAKFMGISSFLGALMGDEGGRLPPQVTNIYVLIWTFKSLNDPRDTSDSKD